MNDQKLAEVATQLFILGVVLGAAVNVGWKLAEWLV